MLEAAIFAVGYEEPWSFEACIDGDSVTGFSLVVFRAFAAEGFEEFAFGAEYVHEVRSVTDDGVDAAIGTNGDGGQAFEGFGDRLVFGGFDLHDQLAVEV